MLAGCGQGQDDPPPTAEERSRWRRQALTWLQADLQVLARELDGGPARSRAAAGRTLQEWRHDPDLAGIRDEGALARLPLEEQQACRRLWKEVAEVLERLPGS